MIFEVRKLYRNGGSVVVGIPNRLLNAAQMMPGLPVQIRVIRPGVIEIQTITNLEKELKKNANEKQEQLTL